MRKFKTYQIPDLAAFKKNLLRYASNNSHCCILDSNQYPGNQYELLAAIGSADEIFATENCFDGLLKFQQTKNDWLFGFLSYDIKNEAGSLSSNNFYVLGFPYMHFFRPQYVFRLAPRVGAGLAPSGATPGISCEVNIGFLTEVSDGEEVDNLFYEITAGKKLETGRGKYVKLKNRISKEEYIKAVCKIKKHIQLGDIYEMNYCMEFFAEMAQINPAEVFLQLNETSHTPFSAFYRLNDNYLLCASPERFLKKEGRKIISQPIKGTANRGRTLFEDIKMKEQLLQSKKEQSENVMIVDLVRNDLSRTCTNVRVEELFGIYTFNQWHQMISTVSGDMREVIHFTDVIKNAFPVGSMTGAPKIRAMELIEQYEKTKRGLYSGAVGYLAPSSAICRGTGESGDADFNFNVVIRSILYNSSSEYLSFHAGSAITANSVPEQEYEECMLKAKGMFEALESAAIHSH